MSCNDPTLTPLDLYHFNPHPVATIIFIIQYVVLTLIGIYFLIKYREYRKVKQELPSEHRVDLDLEQDNNDPSYVILQSKHLPITWMSQGYRVILISKLAAIHLLAAFILRLVYEQKETTFFFAASNAYILLVPVGIAFLNDSLLLMLIRSSEQTEPHLAKNATWYFRSRSLENFLRFMDRVSLILIPMSFGSSTDKDPNTRKNGQYMQLVGFMSQFIQILFVMRVTHMIRNREEYRLSRPHGISPLFKALFFSSTCILIRNTYRVVSIIDSSGVLLTYEWLFWVADIAPLTMVLITYIVYNPLPYLQTAISEMDVDLQPVVATNQTWDTPSPRSTLNAATSSSSKQTIR